MLRNNSEYEIRFEQSVSCKGNLSVKRAWKSGGSGTVAPRPDLRALQQARAHRPEGERRETDNKQENSVHAAGLEAFRIRFRQSPSLRRNWGAANECRIFGTPVDRNCQPLDNRNPQ